MRPRLVAAAATLLLLLLVTSCRNEKPPPKAAPKIPGQVLIIRTVIPGERSFLYYIGVSGGKVRLGSETDQWRLIDVRNRTVTFVDETRKTFRTEQLSSLMEKRRQAAARRAPDFLRDAELEPIRESRPFGGDPATGYRITMGT